MNIRDMLGKEVLFFDGAMGTQLQALGLQPGEVPESWLFSHPEQVQAIHSKYVEAGCNIIKTNTFGANGIKLADTTLDVVETVKQGVALAKAACGDKPKTYVALDMGPTGRLLAPYGDLSFDEAVEAYAQVVCAGTEAGADLILIETMSDTYEIKAALLAAKENSSLPICVTMTFDDSGKLLTGADILSVVLMVEGLGADAVGFNCGLGPKQMLELLPQLARATSLPLIVNPNAGLPQEINGVTVFSASISEYVDSVVKILEQGAALVGGCCGTSPEYLGALIKEWNNKPIVSRKEEKPLMAVSSYGEAVIIGEEPIIIGERINPTGKKRLKQAILEQDYDYICTLALEQRAQGAKILDLNVGVPGIDEASSIVEAMLRLQAITTTPLQIDTANVEAMARGLRYYNGKPLLNSVTGKQESMEEVFPLARKYGATVVALCLDESGIPTTAKGRIAIAEKIRQVAATYGIGSQDLLFDPLALTISTGGENAQVDLQVIAELKRQGLKTVMGVSNISFGLPNRDNINSTFLALALQSGLSSAIINPNSEAMQGAYNAYRALSGLDRGCQEYIAKYNQDTKPTTSIVEPQGVTLQLAVQKGMTSAAAKATEELLLTTEPLVIINEELIPALDVVGKGFEQKTVFLPQLLMSADAAKAAFAVIKDRLAQNGGGSVGPKVVLATVKGDVHDIGKNIVKVLLENYGYQVLDLGKDVEPSKILETVEKEQVQLVGLSALMTTTVGAMAETIQLLKDLPCKVIVGGAVLTSDYAQSIEADGYAADAVEAVRLAQSLV